MSYKVTDMVSIMGVDELTLVNYLLYGFPASSQSSRAAVIHSNAYLNLNHNDDQFISGTIIEVDDCGDGAPYKVMLSCNLSMTLWVSDLNIVDSYRRPTKKIATNIGGF